MAAAQPNPPQWPDSVVWNATQAQIDQIYQQTGPESAGHFIQERYLFAFTAGDHDVCVWVGYYTSAAGFGEDRGEVRLRNVYIPNGSQKSGALNNFWRSIEHVTVTKPQGLQDTKSSLGIDNVDAYQTNMICAVSQAAPMRDVHIQGGLWLFELVNNRADLRGDGIASGMASGGFAANCKVEGSITNGGQQQFAFRNFHFCEDGSCGPVFNGVNIGSIGHMPTPSARDGGEDRVVKVEKTTIIAEKPYAFQRGDKFFIRVPELRRDTTGNNSMTGVDIPFENVFVAAASTPSAVIQKHINDAQIKAIWFAPGNYSIEHALVVDRDDFVLLGNQSYFQQPRHGDSALKIRGKGARLAGITFEARALASEVEATEPMLVIEGEGNADNPTIVFDLFVRVGRFYNDPGLSLEDFAKLNVRVDTSVLVAQSHVIIDHCWIWKADHEKLDQGGLHGFYQTKRKDNPARIGLLVQSDHVTIYGGHAEHYDQHDILWNGNGGTLYMLQNEINYQINQEDVDNEHTSCLKVTGANFTGYGIGAYSNFQGEKAVAQQGLELLGPNAYIKQALAWNLNAGDASYPSGIANIAKLANGELIGPGVPLKTCAEGVQPTYVEEIRT